jgi:hypothetical protein
MQSSTQTTSVSKKSLWAGRIISAMPVLFLLLDGVMKLVKPGPVVEGTVRLGYPESVRDHVCNKETGRQRHGHKGTGARVTQNVYWERKD